MSYLTDNFRDKYNIPDSIHEWEHTEYENLPGSGVLLVACRHKEFRLYYDKEKNIWSLHINMGVSTLSVHSCRSVGYLVKIAKILYYIIRNVSTDSDLVNYLELQLTAYKLAARMGPYKDTAIGG